MDMNFEYKPVDEEGLEILDVISAATKFNNWMYNTVAPFCTGRTLEIGSGVGNISSFFVRDKKDIFLSDIRENYRNILKNKFKLDNDHVLDIDIALPDFKERYAAMLGTFDSVFALNVVEHIENDSLAIENMLHLLKPGGQVTVLVPAHQALYNGIDKSLEHFRRYNKRSLSELMSKFAPVKNLFYFNGTGILAWWIGGKLFSHKTIPEGEMKLYNTFVPVFKLIDKITMNRIGLSVVCVIRK